MSSNDYIKKLDSPGKADIVIAHWSVFGPGKSGLYETVKELAAYEGRMDGVISGIVEPDNPAGGNSDKSIEPNVVTQSHDWAFRDANVHMIHSSTASIQQRLDPTIFFLHGSPEAQIWSELETFDRGFSMSSTFDYMDRSKVSIVFMKRHKWIWNRVAKGIDIRYVQKGIDLERWNPKGMRMRFDGKPNILYGEVWREIKDPFITFLAMDEYANKNPAMRFHPWALNDKRRMWERISDRGRFGRFLGQYQLSGTQLYPEHWYRGGDMLISPVLMGEPSRVLQESLASGCPTVTWDSDIFGDSISFKRARPFDPRDMAEKCHELWEEIQSDPTGIRQKARRLAVENYSMSNMAEKVIDIVREVLNRT